MDPSRQRVVEQSQVTLPHDDNDGRESRGVVEGNCDMVIELGLRSGSVFIENIGHDSDVDDVNILNGFDEPDDDDDGDLFAERRDPVVVFREITGSDIRLITTESCSDDDHENEREAWGIDLNDDDDDDDDGVTIPLRWDSLQIDDCAEDFDWEEVDGGGGEREILTGFAEIDDGLEDEREIEILTGFAEADIDEVSEDLATGERTENTENLEWEVLLNSHSLEINFDVENREIFIAGGDDEVNINTPEYDMLFEQFSQAGLANLRFPPTSRSFIKDLPMVRLDVEKDEGAVICAVCKDEMNIGTEAVGLPCDHKYHTECIVPWLKTRNTCPVCRYELPTDDADYEQRKSHRTTTSSDDDGW
ncbi:RING-type domain-containing protein [Hirschfeldia incana]|nr:RING-type domain-containing protein [Hirschfeldia incana]